MSACGQTAYECIQGLRRQPVRLSFILREYHGLLYKNRDFHKGYMRR